MNSVQLGESWITCSTENFLTREKGVWNILKSNLRETYMLLGMLMMKAQSNSFQLIEWGVEMA
jgi:hypothetical protein